MCTRYGTFRPAEMVQYLVIFFLLYRRTQTNTRGPDWSLPTPLTFVEPEAVGFYRLRLSQRWGQFCFRRRAMSQIQSRLSCPVVSEKRVKGVAHPPGITRIIGSGARVDTG